VGGLFAEDELLLARLPPDAHVANGVPDAESGAARERAAALAADVFADLLQPRGLRLSPLGPAWSRDIDVHVVQLPEPEQLSRRGWLPLDGLFRRLGSSGEGRWLVMDGNEPLAAVDIDVAPVPEATASVVARCRSRGEVRLREVLELRALLRDGHSLPARDPVVALAARIEAGLGGAELAAWADGPPLAPPAPLTSKRLRAPVAKARRIASRRITVAISGVDGAGKSTLARSLEEALSRAGVPVTVIWSRPGMRLGPLDRVASLAKRVLRQDPQPGIRAVAAGERTDTLRSRRGWIGWAWSLLVTVSFLVDARTRHHGGRGVMLYDRHLLDALATLQFAYPGVDTRLQRFLIRRGLPHAAVTFYLDTPAEVALARKPGDAFGAHAVSTQLRSYDRLLDRASGVRILKGTDRPEDLAHVALRHLIDAVAAPHRSSRRRARGSRSAR
jgi:thymidylate kinase